MPKDNIDLAQIFTAVTQALVSNQQSLNQSDTNNQDHGDNMVQTFQTITDALKRQKGVSASKALSNAAKAVLKSTTSSSGKMYAQNLSRASSQLKGRPIDAMGALSLLQTLIGGGQAVESSVQPASGGLLGTLLGTLLGGNTPVQQGSQSGGADLLSMLTSSLGAGGDTSAQMSTQSGSSDLVGSLLGGVLNNSGSLDNLVQAFLGGSKMGDASHRTQSTQLVINSFLQALNTLK